MDDLIKEPDRLEFVDSDHIMNYLQNMDEACENSLMGCEENMGDGDPFDKDLAKLNSTEGLLDNLIRSVCSGINDSTLINKEDRVDVPALADNDSSDMDIIAKSVSLDVIENTQLNEVNVTDKLTSEISHTSTIFEKHSLGADESYDMNEAKKSDSVSVWKSEKAQKHIQSTSKEQDDDIIVLDEKEFTMMIKMEKQEADVDDCEIIEEKKTLSCDAQNSKNLDRETADYAFHIKDNIKQGLSKLAFPSKTSFSRNSAQKKKIPSLRPITNTRITIGEALEKAQDVQKNSLQEKANAILGKITISTINALENKDQTSSICQTVKTELDDCKESLNETLGIDNVISCIGQLSPGSMSTGSSVKSIEEKMLDTAASSPIQTISPILFDEQEEMLKTENKLQEKAKVKSIVVGRHSLPGISKMSDLLKFTFDHEHFPSSVNMARLAKVVGVTWSQIRNWFTNRRVENKKNGIFPRDKVLDFCPYCSVTLKTEVEQKSHLFAAQHIRRILGMEYVGDDHVEAMRWKNSPSDRSVGGNLHSQNLTTADTNNSLRLPMEEGTVESVTNKLGKRWKDSFLLNKNKKCEKVNIEINQTYDSEKAVMEEVKEEYDAESGSKSSLSTPADSECGEHFQDVLEKMEGINSKHLSLCSSVTEKVPFASGTIVNKYVSASQKGKFPYSKVVGHAYKKGLQVKKQVKRPDYVNKSPSIEPNQSFGRSLRIRQKNALSFMEDSLLGYQCPTCHKIFQTEWQMIKHTMTHLLFICDICEKNFISEHALKLHLHDHLTGAYEEEKYYCQFSCKICHSLKCECYDTPIQEQKEISKAFERPQKAKRSKRTFSTKPYSGMNDHLRMTFGNYHKYHLQRSNRNISEMQSKLKADKDILPNNIPKKLAQNMQIFDDRKGDGDKEIVDNCKEFKSDKADQTSVSSEQPRWLSVRKDVLMANYNKAMNPESPCSDVPLVPASSMLSSVPVRKNSTKIEKASEEPQRKARGRPAGRKSTAKDVCIDADFYYMCEICDSSFYSKAELQEHMFFHRLKSRSRRGNKRTLEESEEPSKKTKLDECEEFQGEDESHNFEGFKRFKCPKCKGHFANAGDLRRHKAQVHSNNMSSDSLEVLKCNYCEKTYRRERELRRHLKHACPNAPEHLRAALTVGTTLITLQERGDGPHFTVVNKSLGTLLKSNLSLSFGSGPYKCRYCRVVTKHEKEMKDHIWKDCANTPNIIKKRSQQGTSLEELGFQCQEDEVEDMIMSGVTAAIETDIEEESPVNDSPSGVGSGVSPSSSKSKEPLVCAYCGIWYYRKVSLIKHMKERCIVIPTRDRELLNQGLDLCNAVNRHGNSFCEISSPSGDPKLSSSRGLYKKVQGSVYGEKLDNSTELGSSSSEIQNATNISKVSNEDLKKCDAIQQINSGNKENDGVCSNDSEATSSKQEAAHNKKNTKQKGTRCNRCHEVFISPDAVLAHSSVHHGPKKGLYKCKLCQERFQKYKQLREHVWMHTQETPYKCHLCNARYRISDNILEHLLSVHGYHKAHEKNIFKWLPGRNGKYRILDSPKDDIRPFESEETLEGMDTNLENLAEDMVVTDDIWTGNNENETSSKENVTKNCKIEEQKAEIINDGDKNNLNVEDKCKDSKKICDIGNSDISIEIKNQDDKKIGLKSNFNDEQTEQESNQTVRKGDSFSPTKSTVDKGGRKKVLSSSNDDDGELFSGLSNLDSIIETVNLTDDSFLE